MFKIGSLKLKTNLILAPMSGVSDLPFRILNRRFGCELAFVEMLNVRSVSYKSKKTFQMLSGDKDDRPLGVQLLAHDPKFMLQALDVLKQYHFDLLDFNAACPERKVTRRGEGASLLKDPKKLQELLKTLVDNSEVPVTVKIRSGWDNNSINAREIALYAQDAGIKALFIHGRSKEQGYSGKVNYDVIKAVKKAIDIPVIASGDIFSALLAKKMLDETGCDGLLVARGSFGNPWIFQEIKEFLKDGTIAAKPEKELLVKVMREHLDACVDFYGEKKGIVIFRKFFIWYTKNLRNVRRLREKATYVKTKDLMFKLFDEFLKGRVQ